MITNLHPENNPSEVLNPNVVLENLPIQDCFRSIVKNDISVNELKTPTIFNTLISSNVTLVNKPELSGDSQYVFITFKASKVSGLQYGMFQIYCDSTGIYFRHIKSRIVQLQEIKEWSSWTQI